MSDFETSGPSAPATFVYRVRSLIMGRIALVCVILAASWLWSYNYRENGSDLVPLHLLQLFALSAVLAAAYLVLLRFERHIKLLVSAQFIIDVVMITWFVAETGGLISPYITLYIFLISAAGLLMRSDGVYVITFACVAAFTLLAVFMDPTEPVMVDGEFVRSRAQQIALHDAAFLLVGVLAARLASRRHIGQELRKAEADFADLNVLHSRILASIESGIITTDLDGKVYSFNRAAEEISGLPASQVVGRSVFSVFGDEVRPPLEIVMAGARADEFSPVHFETGIGTADDGLSTQVTAACSVSSLVGRSGRITGLIIAFHDVTERREMEESLRQSDRLAAVGRLSAGLAHEIRNPLGSMSSALQFLANRVPPDTEDAELMAVVLRESERLNRIITDFLTYARPQSQAISNGDAPHVEIGGAIYDCLALLRHDPAVTGAHKLTFDPPKTPLTVRASETQVKQIFWNVLQNGIRAMPNGGEIGIEVRDATEKHIRVIVSDTGCGISSENLKRVFEPFHGSAGGTGLGLSIVNKIVTDLGGRIDIKSTPGKGTRISLDLLK